MVKGLVIGKFYPPHKGHSYLIETALANADMVDVLVCDSPDYHIPARQRANWLRQLYPAAEVSIIPDIGNDDDSMAWAKHTIQFLGYTPDIVFSSEDYGDTYAVAMGCKHHLVDKERKTVPIQARQIRPDVIAKWDYLTPVVRQKYCLRVCVLGAESTGTTTLAQDLAKKYQAPWVPEFGRTYSEAKLTMGNNAVWNSQEFDFIAQTQQTMEDYLAGMSNGLLICDTDAFATRLWHERYMNFLSPSLDKYLEDSQIDLYILTEPDIPFVQDGTRDGEHIRLAMHERFKEELDKHHKNYISVNGSRTNRLAVASKTINNMLKNKVTI